jgi:hypothetical protein
MPNRTGPGTYKGFKSPETGGWPEPIREEVRKVYGAWRSKNPGEDHATKARGARIAWAAARRKYPDLYRYHVKDSRRLEIETRKEMKEHPWAGRTTAHRIALDHARRHRVADLHATARQQRGYAKTAYHEEVSERIRAKKLKKAGRPVQAKDLEKDSKIAADFKKWRNERADSYDMEAERISKVTGG